MVPRILHLHPKTYERLMRLRKQAERDGAYRVAKRLQAVVLNSSGRPLELTSAQRKQLDDILESGPVAYGLDTGIWTSPMIAWVIEEEFDIHYHPGHVRKLLHRLGFSVQRPRRVLARANADQQDRWQRYTYPSLKKKRSGKTGR